nr:MAG TPA: hypothetical protein [Microviridae sp.]
MKLIEFTFINRTAAHYIERSIYGVVGMLLRA